MIIDSIQRGMNCGSVHEAEIEWFGFPRVTEVLGLFW
jgi:hypothetical protein